MQTIPHPIDGFLVASRAPAAIDARAFDALSHLRRQSGAFIGHDPG
jgi:hypothetical protein